jgi:hypothetical protein
MTTQIAALVSTIQAEAIALLAEGILKEYVPNPQSVFAIIGVDSSLEDEDPTLQAIFREYRACFISMNNHDGAEQVSVTFECPLPDTDLRGIIFREAPLAGLIGFSCVSKAISEVETHTLGSAGLVLEIQPASLLKPEAFGENVRLGIQPASMLRPESSGEGPHNNC